MNRLTPSYIWLLLGSIALFSVPLLNAWLLYPLGVESPATSYSALSGIFPWSDATGYYSGANKLLHNGFLDNWNMRRPLNSILFSVRLWLADHNFLAAALIQAIGCAIGSFALSFSVGMRLGKAAGIITLCVLFLFADTYLPTTLSESLGLTLGCLSFIFLWDYASSQKSTSLLFGILMLMVALNARAGAFFVLPLLALWSFLNPAHKKKYNWKALLVVLIGAGLGINFNVAITHLYTNGNGATHGNFGLVLFGLVSGGEGWMHAYKVHPEVSMLTEVAGSQFLYEKSWALFKQQPALIFIGMMKNFWLFLKSGTTFFIDASGNQIFRTFLRVASITLFSTFLFYRTYLFSLYKKFYTDHPSECGLLLAGCFGMIFSALIIWKDGNPRVFAATIPFFAVSIGVTINAYARDIFRVKSPQALKTPLPIASAYILSLLILSSALILPKVLQTKAPLSIPVFSCQSNETKILVRKISGAPQIAFPKSSAQFKRNVLASSIEDHEGFLKIVDPTFLTEPMTLSVAYDFESEKTRYLVGATELFNQNEWSCLCGQNISATNGIVQIFRVTQGKIHE